jgi:hypothetical protein
MADMKEDTRVVKEEFDGLSTPTQIFVAVLVALGIILGALLGLWLAVHPLDEGDPPQQIEWDDNTYTLQGGGPEGEADDSPEGG